MATGQYDAILVLGGGINLDGSLADTAKRQVQKAVDLYTTHSTDAFITSGLYGYKDIEKPIISEAKAYALYAESLGVPHEHIYTEEHSQDTVGNIVFTKTELLLPHNWTRIIVVPQINHLTERIEYVLQKVLGPNYTWTIIRSDENLSQQNTTREQRSLDLTRHINDPLADGDHDAIYNELKKNHPAYGGSRYSTDELRRLLS
jgi:uncharacterized SAM-binding protein YcdF (DUF218 family)